MRRIVALIALAIMILAAIATGAVAVFADTIEPLPTTPPTSAPDAPAPAALTPEQLAAGIPCVVTAYYSPLPDQERYATGSYERDIILNGRGTNGASGKEVFVGMIAAPRTYPFGTKVSIPGFGLGDVQDRGGAIVGNRLDLWMGRGDLGLSRALAWGKRSMTCRFFLPGTAVPDSANKAATLLQAPPASKQVSAPAPAPSAPKGHYTRDFTIGDVNDQIQDLEQDLKKLGFFAGIPDRTYDLATAQAVFAFQKAHEIVTSDQSYGAGYFGLQTRTALNKARTGTLPTPPAPTPAPHPSLQNLNRVLERGASGDEVRDAQAALARVGYFPAHVQTGVFGDMTRDALYRFQLDHKIVASPTDKGAGMLGPVTAQRLLTVAAQKAARAVVHVAGARNDVVLEAQRHLVALGKLPANATTGYLGPQTTAAITAFQVERKLVGGATDLNAGKLGPVTLASLESAAKERQLHAVALKRGDTGPAVTELQRLLHQLGAFDGPATGNYGPLTEDAVRSLQKRYGVIAADSDLGAGMVGPVTKRVFLGAANERVLYVDGLAPTAPAPSMAPAPAELAPSAPQS